jgi:hypothetical protein
MFMSVFLHVIDGICCLISPVRTRLTFAGIFAERLVFESVKTWLR